jgi:hypothetical protein
VRTIKTVEADRKILIDVGVRFVQRGNIAQHLSISLLTFSYSKNLKTKSA